MTHDNDVEKLIQSVKHPSMPIALRQQVLQEIRSADPGVGIRNERRRPKVVPALAAAAAAVMAGAAVIYFAHLPSGTQKASPSTTEASHGKQANVTSTYDSVDLAGRVHVIAQSEQTTRLNVVYPQVKGVPNTDYGRTLNTLLKKMSLPANTSGFAQNQDIFQASYQVTYQQGNLIDFVITTQDTPPASADGGTTAQQSLIYNLKTGAVYSLSDLFKPNSGYLQALSQLILQNDPNHALAQAGFGKPTVGPNDTFVLTRTGIAIVFAQDQWTAHAAGTPAFPLTFDQVAPYINREGALWQAIQAGQKGAAASDLAQDVAYLQNHGYQLAEHTLNTYSLNPTTLRLNGAKPGEPPFYALIGTKGQPGSTTVGMPTERVFFFSGNSFIGTDTSRAHGLVEDFYATSPNSLAIEYLNEQGTFTISYTWNGHTVKTNQPFPSNYPFWH